MQLRRPEHPGRVALVAGVALIAVNFLLWGGTSQVNGPVSRLRPAAIQQLFPDEDQRILPQQFVGVDLRDDYQGELAVDGTPLPKDQYSGDPGLGQVFFEPGPGKELRAWRPNVHRATIQFWPRAKTFEAARREHLVGSYTWPFKVG